MVGYASASEPGAKGEVDPLPDLLQEPPNRRRPRGRGRRDGCDPAHPRGLTKPLSDGSRLCWATLRACTKVLLSGKPRPTGYEAMQVRLLPQNRPASATRHSIARPAPAMR